jgi:predicted nucleic acid-binding protein
MLVVADSSPINLLVRIGHVDLLHYLFQSVVIPTEVARELSHRRTPQAVKRFVAAPPSWLAIREPSKIEPIPRLDAGERAAISLATDLNADLLLIDEKAGRRAATERRLAIIGTIGILERAASDGLIDLADACAKVKKTDFFVSDELVKEALQRQKKPQT